MLKYLPISATAFDSLARMPAQASLKGIGDQSSNSTHRIGFHTSSLPFLCLYSLFFNIRTLVPIFIVTLKQFIYNLTFVITNFSVGLFDVVAFRSQLIKEQMAFKNKNIVREGPFFTHFACLPLIEPAYRATIQHIQADVRQLIETHPKYQQPDIKEHGHNQCHITLFKLVLRHAQTREKMIGFMMKHEQLIKSSLAQMVVTITNVNYFTRYNKNQKCKEVTVIYAEIDEISKQKLNALTDKLMRVLLAEQIIAANELKDMNVIYDHTTNLYKPETLHISLFRARNMLEDQQLIAIFKQLQDTFKAFSAECHYLDVSTMGKEYDETEFYLPLHRIYLTQAKRPLEMKQPEKIQQQQ